MPFTIRSFRRVPVCCPVTYHAGLSEVSFYDLRMMPRDGGIFDHKGVVGEVEAASYARMGNCR